jgi:hypothetical protein
MPFVRRSVMVDSYGDLGGRQPRRPNWTVNARSVTALTWPTGSRRPLLISTVMSEKNAGQ